MSGDVSVERRVDRLRIVRDGRHVTNYVYKGIWRPYFWPINLPQGSVVRGVNGIEHPNHYGACLVYGRHADEGTTNIYSDFDEPPYGPCGRMIHDDLEVTDVDDDAVRLTHRTRWSSGTGEPLCTDTRRYELRFLADDELLLLVEHETPPPGDPIVGKVRMFARVADDLRVDPQYGEEGHTPGQIVNSEGKRGEEATRDRTAAWCDYSGALGDETGGITILNHPDNADHPAEFFTRAYGLVSSGQQLSDEATTTSRWGVYAHHGRTEDADIDRAYRTVREWG